MKTAEPGRRCGRSTALEQRLRDVGPRRGELPGWRSRRIRKRVHVVTPDLAYTVEVESYRARVGRAEEIAPVAVRVTTIFRREDGDWKVAHRHADPITPPRPPESVIQT
jgi:hypothetical protein